MAGNNGAGEAPSGARRWVFGWCEYAELSRQLLVHGQPVKIEGKPSDVLQQLLERPNAALTKDELIGGAWDTATSDQSLTTAIRKLRIAFGGARDDIILNVSGVGYRMAVPVVEAEDSEPGEVEFRLNEGEPIPRRPHWKAVRALGLVRPQVVWLGEHTKTREMRVFKFAADGVRVRALQREVTLSRLLQTAFPAGAEEARGFVRLLDWELEEAPFFIESEYGGLDLLKWSGTEAFASMPVAERVRLAADLAQTVAAAHGLGILHNDLKPTNVLVTARSEAGERLVAGATGLAAETVRGQAAGPDAGADAWQVAWQVKVVDFGVASLSQPERLRQMEITEHGFSSADGEAAGRRGMAGSAMYQAPESKNAPPTALADVYSLGVMLYQIVCGDFLEPPSPGWESRIDDPLLRQDIAEAANIDPSARISSAAALAERLLTLEIRRAEREAGERVLAAAHQAAEALAAARLRRPWLILSIVALGAGLCASAASAWRTAHERDKAIVEAKRASAMEQLTEGLFTGGSDGTPEKGLTVDTLLSRGIQQARGLNNDRPEQAEMLHTLGKVYRDLGQLDTAVRLLNDALQEREQLYGPRSAEVASTLAELSGARDEQDQQQESLRLAQRAYEIDAQVLAKEDPQTMHARNLVASAVLGLGDPRKAASMLEALVQEERRLPEQRKNLSDALNLLSIAKNDMGDMNQALSLNRETLALDRQMLGDKHPDIGTDLISKSQIELVLGDYQRAEADAREALDILRGWFSPGHFEIASAETTLADVLQREGKASEVLPLLTDALKLQRAIYPEASIKTAHTLAALGSAEAALHRPDEALTYYERSATEYAALFPEKNYRLATVLFHEGQVYFEQKRLAQAETALREAVAIDAARRPANDAILVRARQLLADVMAAEHQAAKPLLARSTKAAKP